MRTDGFNQFADELAKEYNISINCEWIHDNNYMDNPIIFVEEYSEAFNILTKNYMDESDVQKSLEITRELSTVLESVHERLQTLGNIFPQNIENILSNNMPLSPELEELERSTEDVAHKTIDMIQRIIFYFTKNIVNYNNSDNFMQKTTREQRARLLREAFILDENGDYHQEYFSEKTVRKNREKKDRIRQGEK